MSGSDTWERGRYEPDVRAFFERHADRLEIGRTPTCVARAPGRLDLMGGFADYSGSLVLQLPIAEATIAAAQHVDGNEVVIESHSVHESLPVRCFATSVARIRELATGGYDTARRELTSDPRNVWASYPIGTLLVLMRERDHPLETGLRVCIESRVPEGKGVSSSAALEVATLMAIAGLVGDVIDGAEVARLCQLAENHVVGAPCGVMDQMASTLGRRDQLLALRCQPAELLGYRPIPEGIGVWGIDSGVRHAVTGSSYTDVRVGAFIGYRILAELAGLSVAKGETLGVVDVRDPRWDGYLANVEPDEFEREFVPRVPETMRGDEFLEQYRGVTDRVAPVDPRVTYAVRQSMRHPIEENRRVERFAETIAGDLCDAALRELGSLMFASHASYSRCGLGSPATDRIVERVRATGRESGLFGAKITGGGCGGTVAILGRADAGAAVRRIADEHAAECGHDAYVFEASSDGAVRHGSILV